MKFALVSNLLPPSWSGQAMMIYHLLRDVDPQDYCLISSQQPDATQQYSRRLPGRYYYLSTGLELKRGYRFGLSLVRESFNITLGVLLRARQIARIVRQEKCEVVMSCSSGVDLLDMPAGYLASRFAGVPFYAYLFDTYAHMWLSPRTRFIGQRLEPYLLQRAAGIVATNEFLQELLATRYGVRSVVIHNPCDLSQYELPPDEPSRTNDVEVRIVYTGAIYAAHYDAFRNLIAAIESLDRTDVKLHLYTGFPPQELIAQGIRGPVVFHEHQPLATMPAVQQQADVLFLPLAFRSPYPELIKVSSPGKVGEFLAARRPILVHAPPDSLHTDYFRRQGCGLVVDEEDPKQLAQALERLIGDRDLQQSLSARAWACAQADFSLTAAKAKFAELLKINIPAGAG